MQLQFRHTIWRDGDFFVGFLNDYPDYHTQGYTKEELLENLESLLEDLECGEVPFVKQAKYNRAKSACSEQC